jgi:4-diphosphocytidyl-2-C-methyl-D-erythritol kinase
MRGIGDVLSDALDLPRLPAVLVNTGVAVPTKDVFGRLAAGPSTGIAREAAAVRFERVNYLAYVERASNDLEAPALALQPVIGEVLADLRDGAGCRLARMSGSGATCFGLFDTAQAAASAAKALQERHAGWWVRATTLG